MKCGIVGCVKFPDNPLVACCDDHFATHRSEMQARRVYPFNIPSLGDPTEFTFNFQNWFWWRGCWRPEAA